MPLAGHLDDVQMILGERLRIKFGIDLRQHLRDGGNLKLSLQGKVPSTPAMPASGVAGCRPGAEQAHRRDSASSAPAAPSPGLSSAFHQAEPAAISCLSDEQGMQSGPGGKPFPSQRLGSATSPPNTKRDTVMNSHTDNSEQIDRKTSRSICDAVGERLQQHLRPLESRTAVPSGTSDG